MGFPDQRRAKRKQPKLNILVMNQNECGVWNQLLPTRLNRNVLESSAEKGDSPVGVNREGLS